MNHNCQILGMYDDMSVMYGQLHADAYKHSGLILKFRWSTLHDLYNGGSWLKNFRNREQAMVKMQQTALYVQLYLVITISSMLRTTIVHSEHAR